MLFSGRFFQKWTMSSRYFFQLSQKALLNSIRIIGIFSGELQKLINNGYILNHYIELRGGVVVSLSFIWRFWASIPIMHCNFHSLKISNSPKKRNQLTWGLLRIKNKIKWISEILWKAALHDNQVIFRVLFNKYSSIRVRWHLYTK